MKRPQIADLPNTFDHCIGEDKPDAHLSQTFQFELITPMFGGDAKSWQLDIKNPVRTASVKGSLRFWWRTLQNESDITKLLNAENSLWGGNTNIGEESNQSIKSPVSIAIIDQNEIVTTLIKTTQNGDRLGDNCIPKYILFPIIQNVTQNNEEINIVKKLSFKLLISYPENRQTEVLNTLKLWMLFGGVGARTRRGTGSLYCEELTKGLVSKADINNLLLDLGDASKPKKREGYPRLTGAKLFLGDASWGKLIQDYEKYRQARTPGNPPGRSYWPEPDAIRLITTQAAPTHPPIHPDKKWFPRAAFGLPIFTKFKTCLDPHAPNQIELEPDMNHIRNVGNSKGSARFPSPMILKTIRLANRQTLSCCLVLNQQFPTKLKLKVGNTEHDIVGNMLPFAPNEQKTMRTDLPLQANECIYDHLARSLGLEKMP